MLFSIASHRSLFVCNRLFPSRTLSQRTPWLFTAGMFLFVLTAGVAQSPRLAQAAAGTRTAGKTALPAPKLVVLIVADQFRADNLTRMGPLFLPGGLRKLTSQGAFAVGHYGQQNTYTGPGHALIATGSYG